eukprot:Nk52_evm18s485 gene=Nk52_evmTU18s485
MTNLAYLHEPAVLNCIHQRYSNHSIYTYSGIVLVAVNPYQDVSELYSKPVLEAFHSSDVVFQLDPHLYAIAEDAYRHMLQWKQSQSIIISGESGAGKTVSAKYVMHYLASVGGVESVGGTSSTGSSHHCSASSGSQHHSADFFGSLEKQIVASNPILEAIGNAKTVRNDNSSRFGKFIQLRFNQNFQIAGAHIRTYLLEKSRVAIHSARERTYHIFYQLCSGATDAEAKEWRLKPVKEFQYTKYGKSKIDAVDDARDFGVTRKAMDTFGISKQEQSAIFKILAAILHLGNVAITGTKSSSKEQTAIINPEDESIETAALFLGVSKEALTKWLCHYELVTGQETVISKYSVSRALDARDALAKDIYKKLFDFLVYRINGAIDRDSSESAKFVGILDIYGFETFEKNSFEQFCINYANEHLQQEFNEHVFKLEQEEYLKEGIDWNLIDYMDNQPCLDLIQGKMGVLALLDEESRLPKGSDEAFNNKLYDHCGNQSSLKKERFGSGKTFVILHYAHTVTYESEGFVEKNRDRLPPNLVSIMQQSTNPCVSELFESDETAIPAGGSGKRKMRTVGSEFKESLKYLMDTIYSTNPNYIRCIKANETKSPFVFERAHALEQLRSCGVLETIRICSAGYPSKLQYEDFYERYQILRFKKKESLKDWCKAVLADVFDDRSKYELGHTKLFMRSGQIPFLEKRRLVIYSKAVVCIQKNYRMVRARRAYLRTREQCIKVQSLYRGYVARRLLHNLKRNKAAIILQKNYRRHVQRFAFLTVLKAIYKLQAAVRKRRKAKLRALLKCETCAVTVQKNMRMLILRRKFILYRRAVVQIQGLYRMKLARRELIRLRMEAKNVNKLQEVKVSLENKVEKLQAKLERKSEELKAKNEAMSAYDMKLVSLTNAVKEVQQSLTERDAVIEERNKLIEGLNCRITGLEAGAQELMETCKCLKTDKQAAIEEIERLNNQNAEQEEQHIGVVAALTEKIKELEEKNANLIESAETLQADSVSRLKAMSSLKALNKTSSEESIEKAVAMTPVHPTKTAQGGTPGTVHHPNGQITKEGLSTGLTAPKLSLSAQDYWTFEESEGFDETAKMAKLKEVVAKLKAQINDSSDSNTSSPPMENGVPFSRRRSIRRLSLSLLKDGEHGQLLSKNGETGVPDKKIYMLAYALEDWDAIQDIIFLKVKPALVDGKPYPALAVMYMIRYDVYFNRIDQLNALEEAFEAHINAVIRDEDTDIEFIGFWLSNCLHLLITLHEDESSVKHSTLEFQKKLNHLLSSLFLHLSKAIQQQLLPLLSAILDHEQAPGVPSSKPVSSFFGFFKKESTVQTESVLHLLSRVLLNLKKNYVEVGTINQLFFSICAFMDNQWVNRLLLRRDLCTWNKGAHILYNVNQVIVWCKANNVADANSVNQLFVSIVQATELLQMRKNSMADVDAITAKCNELNPLQLHKLLSNYHNEDFDESVPANVIKAVCTKAQSIESARSSTTNSPSIGGRSGRRGSIAAISPPFQLPSLASVKRYTLKEGAMHKGLDISLGKLMSF